MTSRAPARRTRLAATAARWPEPQTTAIGRAGSSPSGSASMSCQGVNAEPGMWPASYSVRSRTSRIWTSSACLGSSSSGIRSTRSIGRFSCRQLVIPPCR